jgi:hypothetical protein
MNLLVMPGLVPGIHALSTMQHLKTWMAGTSLHSGRAERGPGCPAMTAR